MPTTGPAAACESRECRPCMACCIYLPIPAGAVGPSAKPADVVCPLSCTSGCTVYTRRPALCADFQCVWLKDPRWPDAWRPDRVGLLCLREEIDAGLPAALVYELRRGALHEPAAARVIEELMQTTVVVAVVDAEKSRRRFPGRLDAPTRQPIVPMPHFLRPSGVVPEQSNLQDAVREF